MTKLDFLKSIGSFLLIPFSKKPEMTELQFMEEEYYKIALDLHKFRDRAGFTPGTRVRCQFGTLITYGTIPPYGEHWVGNQPYQIPIILDNGRKQPWTMSDLTIIPS